jgi:hypothetical protein
MLSPHDANNSILLKKLLVDQIVCPVRWSQSKRSDDKRTTARQDFISDHANAGINNLNCLNCRRQTSCMSNHIAICKGIHISQDKAREKIDRTWDSTETAIESVQQLPTKSPVFSPATIAARNIISKQRRKLEEDSPHFQGLFSPIVLWLRLHLRRHVPPRR